MLSLKGIIVSQSVRRGGAGILLMAAWFGFLIQPAAAQDARQIYQQSADALYNLDFSTAERGFERLTREYPGSPEYWNALASTIWLKIIYDQQKLNLESYASSRFGTRDSKDSLNPADEERLRTTLATAMAKAEAILKDRPDDVRALYALGNSHATLASFEATAKRSYFSAHSKAKEARRLHDRVVQMDPSFNDARLAIGTYDYVVGAIPGSIRWMLRLLGVGSGDKAGGMRQIEITASQGTLARTDARMMLVVIYNREKRFEDALQLIEELHAKYPRNFLFEMSKASIYGKMDQWDDAANVYQQVIAKAQAATNGYERLRTEKVYYELGTSNVERHQFDAAVDAFTHVVRGNDSTENERASAYLWMGKIFDSKMERENALQQYRAVLDLDCDRNFKDEASRYVRRPFGS